MGDTAGDSFGLRGRGEAFFTGVDKVCAARGETGRVESVDRGVGYSGWLRSNRFVFPDSRNRSSFWRAEVASEISETTREGTSNLDFGVDGDDDGLGEDASERRRFAAATGVTGAAMRRLDCLLATD